VKYTLVRGGMDLVCSFSFLVSRGSIRSQLTCFGSGWCWQSDDESVEVRDQEAQDQLRGFVEDDSCFSALTVWYDGGGGR
jgi:hypothetical protein